MEQLSLVPNLNLRRLIKDLLTEGGEGLYLHRADSDAEDDGDGSGSGDARRRQGGGGEGGRREKGREEDREYRFALVAEQILVLKVRATKAFVGSDGLALVWRKSLVCNVLVETRVSACRSRWLSLSAVRR